MNKLMYNAEYDRNFNCSFYNVDSIPESARSHVIIGVGIFYAYCIATVLYVLCLLAIAISDLRNLSTYKLMLTFGIFHVSGLHTGGLFVALFFIKGTVFCSDPTIVYISGLMDSASWCGSTLTGIMLTINRCVVMYNSDLASRLFGPRTIYLWIFVAIVYYLYSLVYAPPLLFNSYEMTFLANPHAGYYDDVNKSYTTWWMNMNNFVDLVLSLISIVIFVYLYQQKCRVVKGKNTWFHQQMFIQIVLIHSFQLSTSLFFNVGRFVVANRTWNLASTLLYLLSQGITPFIYLTFNKAIRHTVLSKILCFKCTTITSISVTPKVQLFHKRNNSVVSKIRVS